MSTHSTPATGCQWYATQMGWGTLLRGNVMCEGNLDVHYFALAAHLYLAERGLHLIGKDLSVFAAGSGEAGGTYGISEKFPVLHALSKLDIDVNGKIKYRTIALMDNDHAGKSAVLGMTKANRTIRENEHLFLLRREMPRRSRDRQPLTKHLDEANRQYGTLQCVIEDQLDMSLCDLYAEQFPHYVRGSKHVIADGHHIDWSQDGKFGLSRFVKENAGLDEVALLVQTLKSLRFYLGLPEDGIA